MDATTSDETLEGVVERTVYHDATSRYTVLRLRVAGHSELVTAVGRSDGVEDEGEVELRGSWDEHPTHGRQFAFSRMQVRMPTTVAGIKRRLMRYPGIREVMAERIVLRFGMDTMDILDRQPRRLLEVDGIGPRTLDRITEHHETISGPIAELEAALLELDLPPHLAGAIFQRYADRSLYMLRQHPYRLSRDVRGIGFLTADRIARAQGVEQDSDERVEAGVVHVFERAEQDGHCALPLDRALEAASGLLSVDAGRVSAAVDRLQLTGDLVIEQRSDGQPPLCFPHIFVVAEQAVARALLDIAVATHDPWDVRDVPDHLSEGQVEAIFAVARAGVVVLTGGPGTGKSTVVRQVLECAHRTGADVLLAAPTGRAAKRLEQATGHTASTVHRLLEVDAQSGEFVHGPGNPLPKGLVVIDESSMLDLQLAFSLLSALTFEHRLLLVGDADQLPSVGPGNVLRDIIAAVSADQSPIPVVRLTQIFRQAEGSSIVDNAHRILAGLMPRPDEAGAQGEFFVVHAREAERAHELVMRTVTERIPQAYGLEARTDIQVLCPMHKGRAGTGAFNDALQAHHTAGSPELELGSGARARRFRVGDRVMQTRNDYQKGVFNGDIGVVAALDPDDRTMTVEIDGAPIVYEGREIAALQLAYAVSIHKSQGSEFPAVVVPILSEHHVMLRRNLLYTAVTRARRLCVVVGDPRAIERAVRRGDAAHRHTGLEGRLRKAVFGEPDWVADPDPA